MWCMISVGKIAALVSTVVMQSVDVGGQTRGSFILDRHGMVVLADCLDVILRLGGKSFDDGTRMFWSVVAQVELFTKARYKFASKR